MKTAKEIKVDNRIRTVLECTLCGSTTYVKARIDAKTSKDAIERSCRACSAFQGLINEGWWKEFGLKKIHTFTVQCLVYVQGLGIE